MKGYKTYSFILISLIGTLGLSSFVSEGEVARIVDMVLQLGGLVGAIYGRYQANK